MPLNPINYSNTIMYKIVCNDLNIIDCYVGHTTDLKSRKRQHKNSCNNINDKNYNIKVYQYIRDNGGWNNWSIIMIEEYDCKSKLEATKRERELIEELKATLNCQIPSRTKDEWYLDNKEDILNNCKLHYYINKDTINEKNKVYYEKNKDIINEKKKIYYEKNKDKTNKSINCKCGGYYTLCHKSIHEQTKKHQNYLLSIASLLSV